MSDKLNKAEDLLAEARETLVERGKLHDKAGVEERSLGAVAQMMTALKGKEYTAEDIGLVLICVKLVRSQQGNYHHDNFVDLAGYAALTGEEAHRRYLEQESQKAQKVGLGNWQPVTASLPPNFDGGSQADHSAFTQFIQVGDDQFQVSQHDNVSLEITEYYEGAKPVLQVRAKVGYPIPVTSENVYFHLKENGSDKCLKVLQLTSINMIKDAEMCGGSGKQCHIAIPKTAVASQDSNSFEEGLAELVNLLGKYLSHSVRIYLESRPSKDVAEPPAATGSSLSRKALVSTLSDEKDDPSKVFMEFMDIVNFDYSTRSFVLEEDEDLIGIAFEVPKSHPMFDSGYYVAHHLMTMLRSESPLQSDVTNDRVCLNVTNSEHDKYMRVSVYLTGYMFDFIYNSGKNVDLLETVKYLRDYLTPLGFKRGFIGKK